MPATISGPVLISPNAYRHTRKGRALDCSKSSMPLGSPGHSRAPGKEENNVNGNLNARAAHPAAAQSAKAWSLSLEKWLAYEQDMATQDDSDRWIAEMEGEAGDATKLTA